MDENIRLEYNNLLEEVIKELNECKLKNKVLDIHEANRIYIKLEGTGKGLVEDMNKKVRVVRYVDLDATNYDKQLYLKFKLKDLVIDKIYFNVLADDNNKMIFKTLKVK